ncbi:unnamed protein product [Rhizophagus irregularis]|nr:unnamed protein product [Rhizophagus irregularis]CAB4404626.1 unnamed protein product [Rhizophagus irregularis]
MRQKMTIRSKFVMLLNQDKNLTIFLEQRHIYNIHFQVIRNRLGDLVFGISLINYMSEFAEAVQEKFSKFKNIEITKAVNYELLVYYLYGSSSGFLRRKILEILFEYWILILPILSENRDFVFFFLLDFGGFLFLDFSSSLCGIEIGAGDFSFLGLTVLFGNKGFRQLVLRNP